MRVKQFNALKMCMKANLIFDCTGITFLLILRFSTKKVINHEKVNIRPCFDFPYF